jgi:hypothetical protein
VALEDIRDNLRDQFRQIAANIQESSAYISLNEKYQSLSPAGQKASLAGAIVVGLLLVMAVPWTFYSGSQTSMEEFESKRTLVRDLFRVTREASSIPVPPPPVTAMELQNNARNALNGARLQPEQITAVNEVPVTVPGVPKSVDQAGIIVTLAKLNLKQVVEIGHELQNLHQMARMSGLEIKANVADPKYYDATYKIVAFSAKPEVTAKPGRARK